jgi:hypothetical protein
MMVLGLDVVAGLEIWYLCTVSALHSPSRLTLSLTDDDV